MIHMFQRVKNTTHNDVGIDLNIGVHWSFTLQTKGKMITFVPLRIKDKDTR